MTCVSTLDHRYSASTYSTDTKSSAPFALITQCASYGAKALRAASLLIVVSNTTTEALAARPTTFDICKTDTGLKTPKAISENIFAVQSSPTDQLITRVRTLGMLQDGWHQEDSLGATSVATDDAERFIRSVEWQEKSKPFISLSEDGEINLFWETEEVYLDLGFVGDGTYAFYGKSSSGLIFIGDAAPLDEPLPSELQALLSISHA